MIVDGHGRRGLDHQGHDGEVDFTAPDRVEVDVTDLEGLSSEITIECWVYGDPTSSRKTAPCSKASTLPGQRVVNVHLPWSNGRVYWDCGHDGGYDRIDQQAQTEDYEGRWNHWAFVKNADTGIMEMYLNGALFHSRDQQGQPHRGHRQDEPGRLGQRQQPLQWPGR